MRDGKFTKEELLSSMKDGGYLPYPEILGGEWKVEDGPGLTRRNARGPGGEMYVPTTDSEYDRFVRIRQMVAGGLSPQQWRSVPDEVDPDLLETAETVRIQNFIKNKGMNRFNLRNHDVQVEAHDRAAMQVSQALMNRDAKGIVKGMVSARGFSGGITIVHELLGDRPMDSEEWDYLVDWFEKNRSVNITEMTPEELGTLMVGEGWDDDYVDNVTGYAAMDKDQRRQFNNLKKGLTHAADRLDAIPMYSVDDHRQSIQWARKYGEIAEELAGMFDPTKAPPGSPNYESGDDNSAASDDGEPAEMQGMDEETKAAMEQAVDESTENLYGMAPAASNKDKTDSWGEMHIINPYRDQALPARVHGPSTVYSDRGSIPRAMHRYCSDKMIFTTKVRKPGGSMLIDLSGSMHLSHEEIEDYIRLIPTGIIAGYSGQGGGGTNGKQHTPGYLRILARDGRMVDEKYNFRMGEDENGEEIRYNTANLIDGPALEWLGKQQFPRVWVSDGEVVGERWDSAGKYWHHAQSKWHLEEAARLVKRHKIVRLLGHDKIEDFLRRFAK